MVPGERIVFASWRPLGDNEWLAPVVAAVADFTDVPDLGGLAAGGGMFAFKDRSETMDLLDRVGFGEVAVAPISPAVLLGGGGDVADATSFLFGMGIVRGLLSRLDDDQRERATARIREDTMILVNTDQVVGREIVSVHGLVMGNTIRSKNVGKDIGAGLKNLVGGELRSYTAMLTEARQEALNRMSESATALGADAVVNVRFTTSQITGGAAELLAYGTAVTLSAPRST